MPTGPSESPSFIGRADAVARLRRAWSQACGGQRAVVWVAGEPGIGKTTLIEHFVAGLGGVAVARGQCVEHYGTGEPYLPVLEALAELCRKDADLPALLRTVAPTWLLQLPWLSTSEERDALRRELAGVGPDRMLREMGELLDRYTEQRPLLLVTEDLHWSDRATIQLIDHVARRRGRAGLMWLATFRVAEVVATDHPLNPLRRELRLHRLCEEIVLDPFSETEVAEYIAQRSPSLARDEAFVRALHERTDGVPLFVSSVITEVMERTDDGADVETRLAAVAVPENLAAIIDHYIDRLGSEQRSLLAAASVCGVEFRVDTLALALGRDIASVALGCDELVREHVWLAPPRAAEESDALEPPYSFKHALFRQVLYDRTPPSARMQLHREVGAALERERAAGVAVAASELAMHFDRGRQPMAALRYYAEAAEAALLHFSPAACISRAERGLALVPQAPEGAERDALELTLATLHGMSAFHSLGVGSQAMNAFERAYALLAGAPEHPMRGRLLHGFGYLSSLRGEYVEALVVAKRAEALASVSDDPVLMLVACFLHGEAHHLQGRTQAARSWMERGLAIAETLDLAADQVFAADPQVTLLGMLAIDLVRCGLVQQGRALVQRAHARAAELRQPMTRLVAVWQEALLEVRVGSPERVAALVDEMQALVDESSLAHGQTACQWFRGWARGAQGPAARGPSADPRGLRTQHPARHARRRQRGARLCGGSAAAGRRCRGRAGAAAGGAADRRRAGRGRVPAAIAAAAGRDRTRPGEARGGRGFGPPRRRGGAGAGSAVARAARAGGAVRAPRCRRRGAPGPRGAGGPVARSGGHRAGGARALAAPDGEARLRQGGAAMGQPAASRARCSHSSLAEAEHHRSDDHARQPEHAEAADAAHQHPDEGQPHPTAGHHRPHQLVAAEQHRATQHQRQQRRRGRALQRELQRHRGHGRVAQERHRGQRAGDRGPQQRARRTGRRVRQGRGEPIEQAHHQHAVHRGAHRARAHLHITLGPVADGLPQDAGELAGQRSAFLVEEAQQQDREADGQRMAERELSQRLRPAEQGARVRVLRQRRKCAGAGELLLPARGQPRPEHRRVGQPVRQREPFVVGGGQAVQQRVRFAEQRPAGEHHRREHEHRDRDREDHRAAALAHVARQPGAEGEVQRPARDRGHAGRQQGLDEAMHDPEGQDDDRGGEEPSRGELEVHGARHARDACALSRQRPVAIPSALPASAVATEVRPFADDSTRGPAYAVAESYLIPWSAMVLNPESKYPNRRAYVLKLRADATPEAFAGRLENLVTGRQHEFASAEELLASIASDLASAGGERDGAVTPRR